MTGTAGEISGRKGPQYYSEPRSHDRHGQDFYIEPAWTVDRLLDAECFSGRSCDPCAGSGTIPNRFHARGLICFAADIIDRGHHAGLVGACDFTCSDLPQFWPLDNIIMNPPYRQAEVFIRQALKVARRKVAVIVQAKFPYSQRRHALFTEHPPARIYFLSTRPSMPPGDKLLAGTVEARGGKTDYCWIVYSRDHTGPTTAYWLKRGGDGGR